HRQGRCRRCCLPGRCCCSPPRPPTTPPPPPPPGQSQSRYPWREPASAPPQPSCAPRRPPRDLTATAGRRGRSMTPLDRVCAEQRRATPGWTARRREGGQVLAVPGMMEGGKEIYTGYSAAASESASAC